MAEQTVKYLKLFLKIRREKALQDQTSINLTTKNLESTWLGCQSKKNQKNGKFNGKAKDFYALRKECI